MVLANMTSAIIQATHHKLYHSISQRTEVAAQYRGTELSVSSLFNGIIKDRLPYQSAWQAAYASDAECRQILQMIESKIINNDTLSQVHPMYRAPMRKSQIRWEHNRLTIYEPIFNSTQTVAEIDHSPKRSAASHLYSISCQPSMKAFLSLLHPASHPPTLSLARDVHPNKTLDPMFRSMCATQQRLQSIIHIVVLLSNVRANAMHTRRRVGSRKDDVVSRTGWLDGCGLSFHGIRCSRTPSRYELNDLCSIHIPNYAPLRSCPNGNHRSRLKIQRRI
jgi:hypothetical protein